MWTLDELVDQVRRALAAHDSGAHYSGAPNGRVRDLPDRRAVRWYATTGLVDRPAGMRGRTALYGRRHLLQLVALKRRQAEGRSLAEIQAELAGADDAVLAAVAQVPAELMTGGDAVPDEAPVRTRFWAASAVGGESTPVGGTRLGRGAILVLPGVPTDEERRLIAAAARPLMDLLAERGLLEEGS